MVGQIQHSAAVSLRTRMAQAREQIALAQQNRVQQSRIQQSRVQGQRAPQLEPSPSSRSATAGSTARQTPPAIPLTREEAELYERLSSLLAKPPRRGGSDLDIDPWPAAPADLALPLTDALETAPDLEALQDAPLEPPTLLPFAPAQPDLPGATVPPRSIPWQQRSRRARWSLLLARTGAWIVTFLIIAATVAGAMVAIAGVDKTAQMLAATQAHAHKIATALYAEIGPLLRH